jgi:Transposase DDE domain group 1
MRLKVWRLWRVIKRELPIQFGYEQLTSHGGLELVRRYFQVIGLNARIRRTLGKHAGGDYGSTHLVLLVIGLLVVGAHRLQHLRYLANDSLFARFCGLSRVPSDRTVVNWLKQFTQTSLDALMRLNQELLCEQIQKLALRRLTIDLDGTVIRTGGKVAWAIQGFNPHHPQGSQLLPAVCPSGADWADPAAQEPSWQRPRLQGRGALRARLIGEIRAHLGRALTLEFRIDAAFFQQNLLKLLNRLGCCYAVKVPLCRWTGVKALIAAQARWTAVAGDIDCFETQLGLAVWGLQLRVVVYRKRVHHHSPKNYQLDLFSPDDG